MIYCKEYSKTWLIQLFSVIPLLGFYLLISCDTRSGLDPVHSVPNVKSTSPANDSADVPLHSKVSITFSDTMDPATITSATFTLMQGTTFAAGTVTLSGATATFTPASNLSPGTRYTATFNTGGQNLVGEPLANNYAWNFTTSALVPDSLLITSSDPLSGATDVPINQKIATTFSTAMDATTITSSTFTLTQGNSPVSGFVSYSGLTALFTPSSDLSPNTPYTITMTTGAKNLTGSALPQHLSWSFTTGATASVAPPTVNSVDPADGATSIPLNQKIAATFAKTMDASSITAATFILTQGGIAVPGFVSYVGTTALFAPSSILAPNTVYTATITTGAKDLAGNPLEQSASWSFTTGTSLATTPPLVNSIDPVNLAAGIPLNQKIVATFSKSMDAATITAANFTLKQGNTAIPGFVSYVNKTALFAPLASLTPNTMYTVTMSTGAKDLAGKALANNYVWSVTTGAAAIITPPTVSLTDPPNLATAIPLNQKIAATFSKTMDASTITTATFTMKQGSTPVPGFISYIGSTATFSPLANLASNTLYTVTVTTGVKDLTGNALASNYVWSFTTGAAAVITPPTVSLTDPPNLATAIPLNQKIAATFSKTMDASTITTATFTVKQGATPVAGFVSYAGSTATFSPLANLASNTLYTVTVTTGVKDLTGNALASDYVWSFTTGAAAVITPPTVSLTDPPNLATAIPLNQKIAATFSKTMDASTITTATFTVKQGATPVAGFVSYAGSTATFSPLANLASNTLYTVTVTTGVKDLTGNALASDYVWSFTTGAAAVITPPTVSLTDPPNLATAIPLNQKIAATFSKTMDASTITTATFTVKQGATPVAGFVSYAGSTATFSPLANLASNTLYTVTVTTGVKDLTGNALASDYVWSFTTGAAAVITPPTVSLTDPPNLATAIPLNQKIAATFSKTMDASTITTATFTVKQGATPVAGFVSYAGSTATFSPLANLASNTLYTVTVTTGVKDLTGNALASDYVWSFTTAAAPVVTLPTVVSTDPENGAIGVAPEQIITATFSTAMDASTLTSATVTVKKGSTPVPGFVSYDGTTATFTPFADLAPNTAYTATVTTSVKDLAGNALAANYVWTFTTGIASVSKILKSAATYASIGGNAGLTNQGTSTVITGDIGTTGASSTITGFHDTVGNVFTETILNVGAVNGDINCAPPAPGTAAKFAAAQQALDDATAAYIHYAGLVGGPDPGAGELGGLVLVAGTYTATAGTFGITTGNLTLDAQNNPNARWVFQMSAALNVGQAGQPRSVLLINGAQAKNVVWVVGSAATLNAAGGGTLVGTIIANSGIAFSTAGNMVVTTLNGRAINLGASVTMVNTLINVQ